MALPWVSALPQPGAATLCPCHLCHCSGGWGATGWEQEGSDLSPKLVCMALEEQGIGGEFHYCSGVTASASGCFEGSEGLAEPLGTARVCREPQRLCCSPESPPCLLLLLS